MYQKLAGRKEYKGYGLFNGFGRLSITLLNGSFLKLRNFDNFMHYEIRVSKWQRWWFTFILDGGIINQGLLIGFKKL